MKIVLERAGKESRDTLFRLLQYSLFEESLTDQNEMNDDALFDYPWFDAYFTEPEREAYLIREHGTEKLLGFAMLRQNEEQGYSIAEFLVIPKYRRKGVGMQAAQACFARHEGSWEVKPAYGSESARLFWKHVIQKNAKDFRWERDGFLFEILHGEK